MNQVYIEVIAMYVIWTVVMFLFRERERRIISCIGLVCASVLILSFTVIGRSNDKDMVSLIPFISFVNAKTQPEFYRTMFMNMVLFLPLGLSLPFVFTNRIKHKLIVSIICGAFFSVSVEALQFFFHIGRCEIDDVLMNTLGVLIGVTSYLINTFVNNKLKRREK